MVSFTIEHMQKLIQRLTDWFSLDTRSLAMTRMALGLAIFVDMLWRMGSAEWHYSDIGAMPRDVFISTFVYPWSYSIHLMSGSWGFAVFILGLHALSALAMALGWRTRLTTLLTAFLTISLHNRNWYVNNGGDDVIRALMFIAVFIPWGEMWSIDQWRQGHGERAPRKVAGTWVLTWFLQAFVIYFVSYILKTSPIWRQDFTAIYYSSHLDIFSTDIGRYIRQFPTFLKFATFGTIMLEWLGPLCLAFGWLIPRRAWCGLRLATVLSFWGLHIGIILTMSIGLFPFYCLGMWAAFIPSEAWDKFLLRFPQIEAKLRAFMAFFAGIPQVQGQVAPGKKIALLSQFSGAFIFAAIFCWNLSTLKPPLKYTSDFWIGVGRWLHIYQEWNMFAPFPKQENLWMEIPAELENGATIELITGERDILSSKQHSFPRSVRDEHWRKFFMNMSDNDKIAKHYAGAWCRMWNRHEKDGGRRPRLRKLSINVYHHVIGLDYQHSPLHKRTVWNHYCFAEDLKQNTN